MSGGGPVVSAGRGRIWWEEAGRYGKPKSPPQRRRTQSHFSVLRRSGNGTHTQADKAAVPWGTPGNVGV